MPEREMNLGAMAEALADETNLQNRRSSATEAVAYAPPAVRRAHEAAGNGQPNGAPLQLEWPASSIPRPELPEPPPETPKAVHEAATDLAHVFEACAIEIERERDKLIEQTEKVAQEATDTANQIRALKDRAVAALHEQTQRARQASTHITETMKKLRSSEPIT